MYASRTITTSSDDIYTKIVNSKGNTWAATGANIQTAIWDLNSTNGGTVWLPKGLLLISSNIVLVNKTAIVGAGVGKTVIQPVSGFSDSWLIKARITASGNKFNNITLRDFSVNGNDTTANVIQFNGVVDFTIQNIEINNSRGNGFGLWDNCSRGLITGCVTRDFDSASREPYAFNRLHDSLVSDCAAYSSTGGAMAFDFHTVYNCVISNLVMQDCYSGIKFFGDSGERGGGNVVSNVVVDDTNGGMGFWIKREHNSSFSNIYLNNIAAEGMVVDGSTYININNLNINNTGDYGIKVDDTIGPCSHININSAIVRNNGEYSIRVDTANNMTISNSQFTHGTLYNMISGSKFFSIDSCTFSNNAQSPGGLSVQTSSFFTITNSLFYGNSFDGLDFTAFANNNYTISGCTFKKNAGYGLDTNGDNFFKITDCTFVGNTNDGLNVGSTAHNFTVIGCFFLNNLKGLDFHASANYYIVTNNICHSSDTMDFNIPSSATRVYNATEGGFNLGSRTWS